MEYKVIIYKWNAEKMRWSECNSFNCGSIDQARTAFNLFAQAYNYADGTRICADVVKDGVCVHDL